MVPQADTSSMRDTLLPELYAVSAEDARRASDSQDQTLDHEDVSAVDGIRQLALEAGIAISAYSNSEIDVQHQYRTLVSVATDALEMARRIRPK